MERFLGTPDKIQETCFKTTVFQTKKKILIPTLSEWIRDFQYVANFNLRSLALFFNPAIQLVC